MNSRAVKPWAHPFSLYFDLGFFNHPAPALDVGADDYVVKPFTPDTLKDKIQKVLGG